MKNKLILLSLLTFLFLDYSVFCQDKNIVPIDSAKDNTENITSNNLKTLTKSIYQLNLDIENILEPNLTIINFDDIIFTNYNSIEISPNRYANVSFYAPYAGSTTYLTHNISFSNPNSLITGYDIYNPQSGGYDIYSNDRMVVEFRYLSKDVSFIWGPLAASYSIGWIDIYGADNQFITTVTVSFPGNWTIISLNQFSQNIKKIVLRRPTNANNLYGHIHLDNFQFTPIPTASPIGTLETVSISQGAVLGWSLDPDNQSASNSVDCYVDSVMPSQFIGRVSANYPSPDLPQYSGNHRFVMPVPYQYRNGTQHQMFCYGIDVTGGESPTLLTGSPKTFKFNTPIGYLDSVSSLNEDVTDLISDGNSVGWSLDSDAPARSNDIHFYIDGPAGTGTFVGQVLADFPRPDVNQQTGYPGNHGYNFSIPDQYRNGVQHTLYAYGIDLTGDHPKLLQGSPKTFTLQPRILSVVYEPLDSALDFNPNTGGGQRIFTDYQVPNDTTIRKKVLVKVTILPVKANVMVYFKNYDLDDPSTDVAPIDNNGIQGNDNRGERDSQGNWTSQSAGTLNLIGGCVSNQSGISCPTDANGVATIEFWTTMQPGDNYAVAAAIDANYLNGITVNGIDLADSNNNIISQTTFVPPARAKRTEMLTVWRKLHIEVDSMGIVQNNFEEGTIPNEVRIRRNETATININPDNTLQINRFEGGRFVAGGASLSIPSPCSNQDPCNTPNTMKVTNTGNLTVLIPPNTRFTVYDDDDFNGNDGTNLDGDNIGNENVSMPDTSLITQDGDYITTNVFASAYVHPKYDIGDNNDNVNFVRNYTTTDPAYIRNLYDFDQRATANSGEFWTIYLLGSYQSTISLDGDPFSEQSVFGVADAFINGEGASVFLEVNRSREYPMGWENRPISQAHTVAHEIGHLFNGRHEDGGLMAPSFERESGEFYPLTLAKIRGTVIP